MAKVRVLGATLICIFRYFSR